MKVLAATTPAALADARYERYVLELQTPGCLPLIDSCEEMYEDGTGVVYLVTPCVPTA